MKLTIFGDMLLKSNVEILEIKRRNIFARIFTINSFKVTFKYNNKIIKINAWVGMCDEESYEKLFYSVYCYIYGNMCIENYRKNMKGENN